MDAPQDSGGAGRMPVAGEPILKLRCGSGAGQGEILARRRDFGEGGVVPLPILPVELVDRDDVVGVETSAIGFPQRQGPADPGRDSRWTCPVAPEGGARICHEGRLALQESMRRQEAIRFAQSRLTPRWSVEEAVALAGGEVEFDLVAQAMALGQAVLGVDHHLVLVAEEKDRWWCVGGEVGEGDGPLSSAVEEGWIEEDEEARLRRNRIR